MAHRMSDIYVGKNAAVVTLGNSDELNAWYTSMNQYDLLSEEEEIELGYQAANGSDWARDKLVKHNLRFVTAVAKRYTQCCNCLTTSDLISEGCVGLIMAAKLFDPTRGFKFTTFAVFLIRQSILLALNKFNKIVMDKSEDAPLTHDSLDDTLSDDSDVTKGDMLSTSDDEALLQESLSNDIMRVINKVLKPREAMVISLFYGFGTEPKLTWEVAEIMGKSEERVRQMKQKALVKLRASEEGKNLVRKYLCK